MSRLSSLSITPSSSGEGIKELNEPNNSGDSPFLAAVSKGYLDVVKILINAIESYNDNDNDNDNDEGNNQIQHVWTLLCSENKAGDTPLSVAVGSNNCGDDGVELLNYLLDKEEECIASIMKGNDNNNHIHRRPLYNKNSHGLSPIMVACERNSVMILQELIKRGSTGDDVSTILKDRDNNGRSPLAVASFCGCFDVAEYLLSSNNGNMLNETDNNGCTPIWLASRTGNVKMVKLLINAGADVSIKGVDDLSVLEVAEKYKKDKVVEYFRDINNI